MKHHGKLNDGRNRTWSPPSRKSGKPDRLSRRTHRSHSADSEGFRKFIRNGLMHDAETRNRWIVERTIPKHSIIEKRESGGYVINRTKFHKAVKSTFEDWIADLRGGDGTLREKMRLCMDEIITMHYSI